MPRIESIRISDSRVSKGPLRSHARFQLSVSIGYDAGGVENARRVTKVVWRRFREFVLLQDCLRMSPSRELLERRQVLLQRYLDNLLAHQQLQSDPALWLFVESERFPEMIAEFRLTEKSAEATAPMEAIKDPQFYQDDLEGRLEYLQKITSRLEILKSALSEFFASQQDMADRITDIGKALSYYIDSTTDGGHHGTLIDLIDSLDRIADLLARGTDQTASAGCFTVIIDDHIRSMHEVEQAFSLKRSWRSAIYTLEVKIIDAQAALIKSQNDKHRNFDVNFRLSENFLKMREELGRYKTIYGALCQRLEGELDRIDARRILETEQGINGILCTMLEGQTEIASIWSAFLARLDGLDVTPGLGAIFSYE